MTSLKHLTIGVVAGTLMSFGQTGMAAAQADSTLQLDIATVAEELELSDEARRELAPQLERLNDALERRREHWEEGEAIRDEVDSAYYAISETLTAAELREFHWLMREAAFGPRAYRPRGRYMMDGGRGYYRGRGAIRGGRMDGRGGRYMRGARGYRRDGAWGRRPWYPPYEDESND